VQDENARLIGGGSERCTLGVRFISLIRLSSVADLTKGACPGAASAGAHARALTRSRLHAHLHHELESGPRREVPLLALLGEEQGGSRHLSSDTLWHSRSPLGVCVCGGACTVMSGCVRSLWPPRALSSVRDPRAAVPRVRRAHRLQGGLLRHLSGDPSAARRTTRRAGCRVLPPCVYICTSSTLGVLLVVVRDIFCLCDWAER
jgi:hypothetical protein